MGDGDIRGNSPESSKHNVSGDITREVNSYEKIALGQLFMMILITPS